MFRYLVVATLFAVGLYTNQASAVSRISHSVNWGSMEEALFVENQTLQGGWKERTAWESMFCSSAFYTYDLGIKAILDDVKLGLQEDGRVNAFVRFDSIMGTAKGSLQNSGTFCRELKADLGLGLEWAEISAIVSFGESGTLDDLSVQVTETRLGRIEMGKYFPTWFESMITGVVNRGLSAIWQSRLGGWLNTKISEYAKRSIPEKSGRSRNSGN